MRYYEIKPTVKRDSFEFSYLEAIQNIICANSQVNPAQFMRLSALFSKTSGLKEGDVLAIEDQDYATLTPKFNAWVSNFTGAALRFPEIARFIEYYQNLPKENPIQETLKLAPRQAHD